MASDKKYVEDRMMGRRCTRCLEGLSHGVVLPIMGCMVLLCKKCAPELLKAGVIPPNTKGQVVKIKKKGGD